MFNLQLYTDPSADPFVVACPKCSSLMTIVGVDDDDHDYAHGGGVIYALLRCEGCGVEADSCDNGGVPKDHKYHRDLHVPWPGAR